MKTKSRRTVLTLILLLTIAFVSFSCNPQNGSPNQNEITVSAAISLQNAFREIAGIYERQTGGKINFNFAASGALQIQIEQSAPADVFASAGQTQMDALANKNFITSETRRDFVRNELVLIVPANKNSAETSFAAFLENNSIRLAVGNPKTVPAGIYAEQTLTKLGVWQRLQPNIVYAEDVRQVLDYVSRGEVDAGIVYRSDLQSAAGKVQAVASAPADSHDSILYPIAVVKNSPKQAAASKFIELVLSSDGQSILRKNGFELIK